jgi:hypothetical protein
MNPTPLTYILVDSIELSGKDLVSFYYQGNIVFTTKYTTLPDLFLGTRESPKAAILWQRFDDSLFAMDVSELSEIVYPSGGPQNYTPLPQSPSTEQVRARTIEVYDFLVHYVFQACCGIAGGGEPGEGTVTSVGFNVDGGVTALQVLGGPITLSGAFSLSFLGDSTQYVRGDGTLATFPSTGSGTVTSVNASIDGTALDISGAPITTVGTLAFEWQGTSGQYVRGDGTLATLPSGAGTVTSVAANVEAGVTAVSFSGSPITSAGTLTLNFDGTSGEMVLGDGTLASIPTSVNIYNTDGTLTGARTLDGDALDLSFINVNNFVVNVNNSTSIQATNGSDTGLAYVDLDGAYLQVAKASGESGYVGVSTSSGFSQLVYGGDGLGIRAYIDRMQIITPNVAAGTVTTGQVLGYDASTGTVEFITVSGGSAAWGTIGAGTGVGSQTDLVTYLDANYYPLLTNPAGYLTSASLTGYVPYTGATADLDMGTHNVTADHIALNVNPSGAGYVVGATQWNNTLGSSQTLLKGGSVSLKNGVDLVARVVNKVTPNTTLTKAAYQVVRVSGATGGRLSVALAQANNDANSADTIGLVTETIATNQEGFIITVGQLDNINTTGSLQGETWVDGDVLYLSPTTAGAITKVKPTGSGHIVVIGYVEYAHVSNGSIYVKVMNGWELDELHDVNIVSPANNQVLRYNSTSQLWVNDSIPTVLGYTPVPETRTITIDGTTWDLSADRTFATTGSRQSSSTNMVVLQVGAGVNTFTSIATVTPSAFNVSEIIRQTIFGTAVSFTRMTIFTQSQQSGTGSMVVTLRVNGADTALSFTILPLSVAGPYSVTGTVAVGATDRVSIRCQNNATTNSASIVSITTIYTI